MITLEKVTMDNYEDVVDLTTNKDGEVTLYEKYVASNAYSLLESFYEEDLHCLAICEDSKPKGFVMYGAYPEDDNQIWIHRFMVDYQYQNSGIGAKAMKLIQQAIVDHYHLDTFYLGIEPENVGAERFYYRNGFVDDGRVLIEEKVLAYHFQNLEEK